MRSFMPTKVFCGENCLILNKHLFKALGEKALIVCGRSSAAASGALDDVLAALTDEGIRYEIYNGVLNNPTVLNAYEAGGKAAEFGADFIIGIGGGSPLDAAKAAAVYATNRIEPMEIYGETKNLPLPVAAIPTTAGTGSEVTPYSVLTIDRENPKVTVKGDHMFPKLAFLDHRYTKSLPADVAVHTALDALSHAVESILCKRNSYISEYIAREAIGILGEEIENTLKYPINPKSRERLLYASMLAGVAITHTGTTIIHSMGYSLTYFMDMPHGFANGALLPPFLRRAEKYAPREAAKVFSAMHLPGIDEFCELISRLLPNIPKVSEEDAEMMANVSIKNKNILQNLWSVTKDDEKAMFLEI